MPIKERYLFGNRAKETLSVGRETERRAKSIVSSLVEDGLFKKMSNPSKKQDSHKGIDLFIHIDRHDEKIKIPVQIKTSAKRAEFFRDSYNEQIRRRKIIVFVVNSNKSDDQLKSALIASLNMHWRLGLSLHQVGVAEVVNAPV